MVLLLVTTLGLVAISIARRRQRGVLFFWVPAFSLSLFVMCWSFIPAAELSNSKGPGGGGEWIAGLAFCGSTLLGIAACTALIVWRPNGAGWRFATAVTATVIWLVLLIAAAATWFYATSVRVRFEVVDHQNSPLTDAIIEYRLSTGGDPFDVLKFSFSSSTRTDAVGVAEFRTFGFQRLNARVWDRASLGVLHVNIGRSDPGFCVGFVDEVRGTRTEFGPQQTNVIRIPPARSLTIPVTLDSVETVRARIAKENKRR